MPSEYALALGSEISRLNVAKKGATTYYVDVESGNDAANGLSWQSAKKTIQAAVDTAEDWATIYVAPGIYDDYTTVNSDYINVYINGKNGIKIIASGRWGTTQIGEADPADSNKIAVHIENGFGFEISGFDIGGYHGLETNVRDTKIHDCTFLARLGDAIYTAKDVNGHATQTEIWGNEIITAGNVGISIYIDEQCKIHNNYIYNCAIGIVLDCNGTVTTFAKRNVVFHNNFVDNTTNSIDTGTNYVDQNEKNMWSGNFWDSHSNKDNGHGICTEPYVYDYISGSYHFITTDLRPVPYFNGWNSISLLRTLLRKNFYGYESGIGTTYNGTSYVDIFSKQVSIDTQLTGIIITNSGTFVGTPKYRIVVDGDKVYPYAAEKNINSGVLENFDYPINVPIRSTYKVQVRSTDAGDTTQTATLTELDKIAVE